MVNTHEIHYNNRYADKFKQAHQLAVGDVIALHYGKPTATVLAKVTGNKSTVVILEVPNDEPVRLLKTD